MNKSKYGNRKTIVDGLLFDSKREAARYQELKLLEAAGEISGLKLQPKFILVPKTKTRRAVTYTADFRYTELMGNPGGLLETIYAVDVVEDVKSPATVKNQAYIVKRNLLEYQNPDIEFREVM